MSHNGWIGVDLDGTLAEYNGWKGPDHIGAPVPKMLARVMAWIIEGKDVRILTARVSHDGTMTRIGECHRAEHAIRQWCLDHIGITLPITCAKDYSMVELWDDRAVQVIPNTGERADHWSNIRFDNKEDFVVFLDSLHSAEGSAVTNHKWGPAQAALAAVKGYDDGR